MSPSRKRLMAEGRGWLAGSGLRVALFVVIIGRAACGRDAVAPSSAQPWSPPHLDQYEGELAQEASRAKAEMTQIDPRKVYDLPELIDIAHGRIGRGDHQERGLQIIA